ncbi:MAG: adenosylcobinamide amidohydrolase [Candidatus Omnitrophota bacterium]|nr:adenosylcobinamide amidohydrolase [Candidatus Omnitrophota bacterium]
MTSRDLSIAESRLVLDGRWLIVSFACPHECSSWAIVGGGSRVAGAVAWYRVTGQDLKPPVDPRELLRDRLREKGWTDAVGLLTSADLERYVDVRKTDGDRTVRCIGTVGLSNAVRVGDRVERPSVVNTINLLCEVSVPLTDAARLEAMTIVTEARTVAVLEAKLPSIQSGFPASGTGTDCIVVASAVGPNMEKYAGKHTRLGALIGRVALETMTLGIEKWREVNHGKENAQPKYSV